MSVLDADELVFIQGHQLPLVLAMKPRLADEKRTYDSQTAPPTVSTAPHVSGTGTVGQTLTCTMGNWTNQPVAYAYQWLRGATPILGATADTRVLTAADSGQNLSCTVTATTGGGSASSTSNAVAVT